MIGDYRETDLLQRAREVVEKKLKGSTLLDSTAEQRFPKYKSTELQVGRVLGRGGFCVVNEITRIVLSEGDAAPSSQQLSYRGDYEDDEEDDIVSNIVQDRAFMSANCIRKGKQPRYALKALSATTLEDAHVFINGIVDLVVEAQFLAVIRHPNIIKMRAMAMGDPYHRGFFVVLDRLYDTLTQRVNKWKKQKVTGIKKILDVKNKKAAAFWVERITVAYDISSALKHLHSINVVYRDLKPDNIGFDVRGDVKIFDFGLAKELSPDAKLGDLYKLTGDTGSLRYMAPEVFLNKPYSEKVDSFSFAVLLWYICAMELPYDGYSINSFERKVIKSGHRPKIDPKWSPPIGKLMKDGWGEDIDTRPSMKEVAEVLRTEINKLSDAEVNEFLDASRKSELSQHERWAVGE